VAAPALQLRWLGRAEYLPTWQAMREFTAQRDAATLDELWLVEHPPVFTLGQAGRRDHLLAPGDIPVVPTDRGGQVTYHGPGQVLAYPLLDLRRLGIYVKELVFRIEQATIQTLDALGVEGRRVDGAPGVYVALPRRPGASGGLATFTRDAEFPPARERRPPDFTGLAKIAALGIKVTRGCSYHGVALNVAMDLSPFNRIDPCGYSGLATVDLATLGANTDWTTAAEILAARLTAHLSR
jgi:lipoyl(octanoyl) transferase